MYNSESFNLGNVRSVIRELFEYGKTYAETHGKDSLFDFSLGNPSIPAPGCVNDAIKDILDTVPSVEVHGYTSAQGDKRTRTAISDNLNRRFSTELSPDDIYITCGAAASLTITLKAVTERPDDEVIIFAPYFPEYNVFIKASGAIPVAVCPDENFRPDFDDLRKKITEKTRAVIINSPNNPSGAVYDEKTIKTLCGILTEKSDEFGRKIVLISDEPYREIVYDGKVVPFIMNYYADSVVCYSFSKSLSLPGERIGYVAVNPNAAEAKRLYLSVCGAGRALGYVCAPSLMQAVIARCIDAKTETDAYKENRDLLCKIVKKAGFEYVNPDGAFYLFIKSPVPDANIFSEKAKELGLLLVPSDSFGVTGYVRAAYCVSKDMIIRSEKAFLTLRFLFDD